MGSESGVNGMTICRHEDEGYCCMRYVKKMGPASLVMCDALNDCNFKDGYCHFRKERYDGPNLYDQMIVESRSGRDRSSCLIWTMIHYGSACNRYKGRA